MTRPADEPHGVTRVGERQIRIPFTLEQPGVTADGMRVISPDDPRYADYDEWLTALEAEGQGEDTWTVTGTIPDSGERVTLTWRNGIDGWDPDALDWALAAATEGLVHLDDGPRLLAWLKTQGFSEGPQAAAWDKRKHPRVPPGGEHGGEFTRNPATGRPAAQTPSQFTHPDTGHAMGKTEIGDTFEALFAAKGAALLEQAYGGRYERTSGAGGPRNTPLDFRLDHTHAGELKTLNIRARNQKTAIKAAEAARKNAAAQDAGMSPLLVVQVVDPQPGRVEVYAFPGFVSRRMTAMEHVGGYDYSPADFWAAQEATGHWAQRKDRAAGQGLAAAAGSPAEDDTPEPGDTVIELRDGVPWIFTQPGTRATFDPQQARDERGRWTRRLGREISPGKTSGDAARRYSAAFEEAFKDSPFTAFVNHYTPAQIEQEHMIPILADDGKAGVLIHDHGDGRVEPTALFNASGRKGAGIALLRKAVTEHGANYVECFGPVLPRLYATLGFEDDQVFDFDQNQAPAGWDTGRFYQPAYHTMRLREPAQVAAAAEVPGLDLDAAMAEAQASDPAWWKQYGEQALTAARVAFGIDPPT